MPYCEHPELATASDVAKIWRYLTLGKFLYLLEYQTLHFSALGDFEDTFEGTLAGGNYRFPRSGVELVAFNALRHGVPTFRRSMFVNCWYVSDFESAAMWALYSRRDGIAIQTTVGSLRESISRDSTPVYIGLVRYMDYASDFIPENNAFHVALSKRMSFEHEHELRAIVLRLGDDQERAIPLPVKINVDIARLIEHIAVAPRSADWFKNLIVSVATRYGIPASIIETSDLDRRPLS